MKGKLCHDNFRSGWHGNGDDNVDIFGLGGVDLVLATAITYTTRCYEQVRHATAAAAVQYSVDEFQFHIFTGGAGDDRVKWI